MKKDLFKRATSFATAAALTVSAAVSVLSVSPAISVSAANADTSDYAKALQYSLYFYDANMCGDEVSEKSHVTWRDNCHTYSDVPGGFHDAGDHVMFGLPQGYTASTLGWGYYEYSDVYEELGLVTHFKMLNDHFCQYFKDSTKLSNGSVTNFMYQAGDGSTDHSYWLAPENQTKSQWGSSLWTSNGASNIAAEYAASLAISYINFGNEEDLTYAKALFAFANQYRSNMSVNEYGSEACEDDICWAAGWLYLATNDSTYKNVFNSLKPSTVYWIHCWNNVTLGNAILDGYINNNWSAANNYISGQVNSSNSSYWFLQQWGSARYNAAMQLCALVVSKHTSNDYTSWAKWQMTYLLGGNGAKACFVVGLGDNSAKYPHHRAASGWEGWDGSNGVNGKTGYDSDGHTLYGALVGGPTSADGTYTDSVNDYTANEVALDYNAAFVGAAAGLYEVYKTGSVVTYIDDEIEVCLDSQSTAKEYAITSYATNCSINLSATQASEGTTVTFTLSPTLDSYNDPTVKVTTSSGATVSYSSSNGTYSFAMPAEAVIVYAEYTEKAAIVYGDANGDGIVNSIDATIATRYAMKIATLSDTALISCDVNGDGVVNSVDATIIARYALKVMSSFPVEN